MRLVIIKFVLYLRAEAIKLCHWRRTLEEDLDKQSFATKQRIRTCLPDHWRTARRRLKTVLPCGRHYISADYYQRRAVELFLHNVNFSFHRFSGLATLLEPWYLLRVIAPSPCMSAGDVTNHRGADISGRSFKFQPPCPQIWPWGSLTCFYWKCKQMLLLSRRLRQEHLCTERVPARVLIEVRTKFETLS